MKECKDAIEYIDYIRQKKICSGLYTPNYTHKQRDQNGKHIRGNIACLLLYPQDDTHYNALLTLISCGYNFAGCIHDRDLKEKNDVIELNFDDTTTAENNSDDNDVSCDDMLDSLDMYSNNNINLNGEQYKGEHIHIVVLFGSRKTNTAVAKEIGISSNYVRMFSGKPILKQKLLYLIHKDDKSKFQYSPNDVFGTSLVFDFTDFLADSDISSFEQRNTVLNYINRYDGYLLKSKFVAFCTDNGLYGFVCGSNWALMKDLINEHNLIHYYNLIHTDNKFDGRSSRSRDDFCVSNTYTTENSLSELNNKLTNILDLLQKK